MINLIVRYRIITNINSPTFVIGNYIEVNWDDSTNLFVVYKYADSTLTSPSTITTGPDLGADRIDFEAVTATRPIPYSFCDGTDLQSFGRSSIFPYANKISTPNHFSCVAAVCDLAFSNDYRTTPASDSSTADGTISVNATSSQGNVRYSLNPDFDHAAGEGQETGNFTGLYSGEYTITAKDALGCIAQITVTVDIPTVYGVRYRLDYVDHYFRECRTDIEERGYDGVIEEVEAFTDDPVIIKYLADGELNKFKSIIPSELRFTLSSQTNFQYRTLFSQDERKYKIKHYTDFDNIIPGQAEIPGDTVAVSFLALSTWTNFAPTFFNPDWSSGVTREVTINQPFHPRSARLYTDFAFVAGNTYDIDLDINVTATGNKLHFVIYDEFNVVQFQTIHNLVSGIHVNVNLNFVATASCKRIGVYVSNTGQTCTVEVAGISGTMESDTIPATEDAPAGLELIWQGFVISSNYQEAYIAPPYPVEVIATDGLADLKNYDFADYLDNLYTEDITPLKAITDLLRRTDLNCNFLSAINKYEENMDSGEADDPLNQVKFNPETFYFNNNISDAYTALDHIFKSFGAVLKMRKGKFFAYIMEQAVDEMPYREFDYLGDYVGNGTFDDVRNINFPVIESGAMFKNMDQVLEILPTYGKFYFEHTLLKQPSLIDSYSFEEKDVYEGVDGITLFKNWNVSFNDSPGATYGIKETKSFEGAYNFFYKPYNPAFGNIDVSDIPVGFQMVSLLSKEHIIEYGALDTIEFRFQYAAILGLSSNVGVRNLFPKWVRLKWMVKVGDYYLNDEVGWTDDVDFKYNDIYLDNFNDDKEFKLVTNLREVGAVTTETLQVEFIFETDKTVDYLASEGSFTDLKAIPTTEYPYGKRVKGLVSFTDGVLGSTYTYLYHELVRDTEAESLPEFVRPNDYHATTNRKVWKIQSAQNAFYWGEGYNEKVIAYWYLDNVVLRHLPEGAEPPANITIERTNNRNIRVNFEDQYLLNDIDIDNINNSERTYINFYKLLDGTPSQVWERSYRPGQGKLMALLSSEFISQYQSASNKLTGSFLCVDEILPTTVMREVNDGNTKYMFMGYEMHVKSSTVVFDMAQVRDVVTDDESSEADAGFSTGFSLGFRA